MAPQKKGVVRLEINSLSKLATKLECEPVVIGNIDWILGAHLETSCRTDNAHNFGVFLKCQNDTHSNLWSFNASVRFVLIKLSSNGKREPFSMEFEQKFDMKTKILDVPNFHSWIDLFCPYSNFIADKRAVIEAHVIVKNTVGVYETILENFEEPKENLTDVVLIVEGKKVHVGRQYLASNSRFFFSLFFSKFSESSQNEITLEDVIHSEFVDLLNLIYPTHKSVNKSNVKHLLKLAHRFDVPFVLEKCEAFLIGTVEIHTVTKLKYAEIYNLSQLQDECLYELDTSESIVALSKHEDYASLGDVTYSVLLQRMIGLVSS
uniref:BTB domain-containing protein n=1 Tax=Caenorhabditis japonica TaxID=281687 RepID=A0A8R1HZ86_CAEJA